MKILKIAFAVAALALAVSANAHHEERLKKGLPKAAGDIIDRIVECQHWLGEPAEGEGPEIEARRKEIKKAIDDLRCEGLDADRAVYLRKQKNKKKREKIKEAFDQAGDLPQD